MVSILAGNPRITRKTSLQLCRTVEDIVESDLDAEELLTDKKHQSIDKTTRLVDNI